MSLIFLYTVATVLTLFFLGFGLSVLVAPPRLKPYIFWLIPWFSTVFLIFSLVVLSLLGLNVRQASPIVITFLCLVNVIVVFKNKLSFSFFEGEKIAIVALVLISILFNLSPLLKNQLFMTTISMGNHDVHAYALTSDYLINHPISDSFYTEVPRAVHTLLRFGYRFGVPIIASFFLNLFSLEGYQFISILQATLFALTLPLLWILFKLLYKSIFIGLILVFILTAFNVNLLYMLYHNFFGQILFWGLGSVFLIFFISYFYSNEIRRKSFNLYDLTISLIISVLLFSYYEGLFLILLSIGLYFMILILTKKFKIYIFLSLLKITIITFLTSFFTIFHAISFLLFYRSKEITAPTIGWQVFRSKIPYANPFEAMGFWSMHNFDPMPTILAVILSVLIIFIIAYGIWKSKYKLILSSFAIVCLLFLFISIFIAHNFWLYNRILTFSLPVFVVMFTIGFIELFQRRNAIRKLFLMLLIIVSIFNALKLNKRYLNEYIVVDKSLISLKELKNYPQIKESIYTSSLLDSSTRLWKQIWFEYFVYSDKLAPKTQVYKDKKLIDDNTLILESKSSRTLTPDLLLKNVVWENKYYKLGRLCNSDKCLKLRKEDLSKIIIGKTGYEDSLLTSGWSEKEPSSRWAVGRESTLRLVSKKENYTKLVIEALTLKEPQELFVYINNQFIGKKNIKANWQEYNYNIQKPLSTGVYNIIFKFSNIYRPIDLGLSQDMRELTVNIKNIKLE